MSRFIGFGDVSDGSPASEVTYWVVSAVTAIPLSMVGGVIGYVAELVLLPLHAFMLV